MGAPEGTGISSNLVLELLHGLGAQWSPVGEGVPEMTRLEKIPWEGEFTLRRSLSAAANGLILVMELLQVNAQAMVEWS